MARTIPESAPRTGPRRAHIMPGLQSRGLRHHRLVPRRVEDEFDVGVLHGRDQQQLLADVGDQDFAHAAAGSGQRHADGDVARAVLVAA